MEKHKMVVLVAFFARVPIACAGADGEDPGSLTHANSEGHECIDMKGQNMQTVQTVCCETSDQEISWHASCNQGVIAGCQSGASCTLLTGEGIEFTCPEGVSCKECAFGVSVGVANEWCDEHLGK